MDFSTLNLGILAHVDAGKTTLTERLLFEAGAIDRLGSVDAGTTQTDSLALERQRGITIRSAVASFAVERGGEHRAINLIDTPGHPDFIAEVDRVLGVLDGAVLVISAVEGVQPQTRVLMRALRRIGVPTMIFINKTDRPGADVDRVLDEIARRLPARPVPVAARHRERAIEALADADDALLADYLTDAGRVTDQRIRAALAAQTAAGRAQPVYAGSAATGAGVDALMAGLVELLPAAQGSPESPVRARIFKIERGVAGEKVAYVRLFAGTLRVRDALTAHDKVSALAAFDRGRWIRRDALRAGEVGRMWGARGLRVGDRIGPADPGGELAFPPPMLETVIEAVRPGAQGALKVALTELAEQDPLIDVRIGETGNELAVSLYGEVQREVIEATLAAEYGLAVRFHQTTPLCIERPTMAGEAAEVLNTPSNPYQATIGLRIEPAAPGSGIVCRLLADHRSAPLYIYRTVEEFADYMEQYVRDALRAGRYGWPVSDCVVTLTRSGYSVADGPPSQRGPTSTASDFRKLTPLVVRQALAAARVTVCEPVVRATVDAPMGSVGALLAALSRLDATVETQSAHGDEAVVEALLTATRTQELFGLLPGLTGGEGVLDVEVAGYRPVIGRPPRRG